MYTKDCYVDIDAPKCERPLPLPRSCEPVFKTGSFKLDFFHEQRYIQGWNLCTSSFTYIRDLHKMRLSFPNS